MSRESLSRLTLNVLLTLGLFASATQGRGAQASDARASDEAAVRGAVKELESGWNAKSGALFSKPFAEDADYVVINGLRIRGRAAIAEGHQRIFDTVYKGTTLALAVEQVRFLRADVAVAHVSARLRMAQEQDAREAEAVITLVMTKEAGAWKIDAFQNTRVEGRQK